MQAFFGEGSEITHWRGSNAGAAPPTNSITHLPSYSFTPPPPLTLAMQASFLSLSLLGHSHRGNQDSTCLLEAGIVPGGRAGEMALASGLGCH